MCERQTCAQCTASRMSYDFFTRTSSTVVLDGPVVDRNYGAVNLVSAVGGEYVLTESGQ